MIAVGEENCASPTMEPESGEKRYIYFNPNFCINNINVKDLVARAEAAPNTDENDENLGLDVESMDVNFDGGVPVMEKPEDPVVPKPFNPFEEPPTPSNPFSCPPLSAGGPKTPLLVSSVVTD